MKYSTIIILFFILSYPLLSLESQASQTFYVDNACAVNGDGTSESCARERGGRGAWNALRTSRHCTGMRPGDILEIRQGKGVYQEGIWLLQHQCSGTRGNQTIIQNYPGEHVVFDGTVDIRNSTWTHQGGGVYLCAKGQCGTTKKFPFTAWYDTGSGEKRLNLKQSNRTCDRSLKPGEMRYTPQNQVCVRLDDSSNPARAAYFKIPFVSAAVSIANYGTDYLTFRKNPKGGSFTIRRFRDHGISTTTANLGIAYDGLDIGWVMDRCINQSQGGHKPAAYRITNNHIHHCGQEGIRWSQDTSPEGLVANNLVEHIQVEPLYERCHPNCFSGFRDNGTAIRAAHVKNGKIINNTIRNIGGANKGRAYGINLENGAESVEVKGNFVYNIDLGTRSPNAGHAYLLSDAFNHRFNKITLENNIAHNVDVCFAFDTKKEAFKSGDTVVLDSNICSEPFHKGLELQDGIFRGTFSVKNNIFVSRQSSTSALIHLSNLTMTPANAPEGNLLFCPHCPDIAIYNHLRFNPKNLDQFGIANRYDTIHTEFNQAIPSITVNGTVYTGGHEPTPEDNDDTTESVNFLVLEVEDFDQREGTFEIRSADDASGASYMAVPKGVGADYDGDGHPLAKLYYDLKMQPGTYVLWMRVFGVNSGSNSFHVFIDHNKQKTFHVPIGEWTWKQVATNLQLDGVHQLTLALRESETRGDKIVITDDPTFIPKGLGPESEDSHDDQPPGGPVSLFVAEAEAYDVLEGAFTVGSHPDASQGTYMVVPKAVGSDYDGDGDPLANLHYQLNMSPGTYHIWVRARGQDSGSDSLYQSDSRN